MIIVFLLQEKLARQRWLEWDDKWVPCKILFFIQIMLSVKFQKAFTIVKQRKFKKRTAETNKYYLSVLFQSEAMHK